MNASLTIPSPPPLAPGSFSVSLCHVPYRAMLTTYPSVSSKHGAL